MGTIHDADALALYLKTLECRRYRDYIQWKKVAVEWVRNELRGETCEHIHELMYEYVSGGGELKQKIEKRPEYIVWRFFYEIILPIGNRKIYVETILVEDDEPDPTIRVVSIHDAN